MDANQHEATLCVKLLEQCCCRDDSSFCVRLTDVGIVEPDNVSLNGQQHICAPIHLFVHFYSSVIFHLPIK